MPNFILGSRFQVPGSRNIAVFLVLGAMLFALTGCSVFPSAQLIEAPVSAAERPEFNLKVYDTAWALVNRKHFDRHFRGVDWAGMGQKYRPAAARARNDRELYGVLAQLCGELGESHLTALPPRRAQEVRTNRRVAVGMGWSSLDGRQVVTDLIPGGPAENAGVQPGWIVVSCEGFPVSDAPPRTPRPGQPVTFGFLDLKNEARSITFEPELLPTKRLASEPLPGGHRYLRFDRFDRESLFWLNRELKDHRDAPGVIIDLRENAGGFVYSAKLAIAQFFDHRVSAGHFIHRSGRITEGHGWPLLFSAQYRGDVVILIDPRTASAAEIFAHVLQYENRATLIGRRTAGAVVISRNYPLPGGGTLQVPIQDYRGRDNQRLEGRGVLPDVEVAVPKLSDLRSGRDPDLEAALATLGASPGTAGTLARLR